MIKLTDNLRNMIQDHSQRLRKHIESKSSSYQFLLGDEAIAKISSTTRSYKIGMPFVDEKDYFDMGDEFYVMSDINYLFLIQSPRGFRVGVIVLCISSSGKISTKTLYFNSLDREARPCLWDEKKDNFYWLDSIFAKTDVFHDIYDYVHQFSDDISIWKSIKGKSFKVADIIKYKSLASFSSVYDVATKKHVYPIEEKHLPVFSFSNENILEKIAKQDEFNQKKLKWGRECKNYRAIRNEQNKWGVEDKDTEELVIDYVFDKIEWIEDIDCVKFTLEGKEAIWHISKLRELS